MTDKKEGAAEVAMESLVDASIREGVEAEKCVVSSHRTTAAQKEAMTEHMKTCDRKKIPIEWVIDIADESSGWFYATAYHFDDTTRMVHVMLPDKHNPSFDGHVLLDYRTMHLIECVDGKTDALFNKIIRDSIIKIRWELKWFEEDPDATHPEAVTPDDEVQGRWIQSIGRYYIRIANQLLVEDEESVGGEKGFVMITADVNVRLHHCSKGRGQEDFNRLVLENQTQSTTAAVEEANLPIAVTMGAAAAGEGADAPPLPPPAASEASSSSSSRRGGGAGEGSPHTGGTNSEVVVEGLGRVWDTSKDLKECISELLDEKEKEKADRYKMARAFTAFSLHGDLDAGLLLYVKSEEIAFKEDAKKLQMSASKGGGKDDSNALAEETWHLVQKVEKGLGKLVRTTAGSEGTTPNGSVRRENRMRKDLAAREKELHLLKGAVGGTA